MEDDGSEDNYVALGMSVSGKRPLEMIVEKLALHIIRVEAEGPLTLFEVLGLLGSPIPRGWDKLP